MLSMPSLTRAVAALALLAAVAAPPARADEAQADYSGEDIVRILHDNGYKALLETDKQGDPMIRSAAAGSRYTVYFYDCTADEPRRCKALSFFLTWTNTQLKLTLDEVNEFSNRFRTPKMTLRDEVIAFQVNLPVAATAPAHIVSLLTLWERSLANADRFFTEVAARRKASPS